MDKECVFCDIRKNNDGNILFSSGSLFAIPDGFPASPGHILIVSKEHREDLFGLSEVEMSELYSMIRRAREHIESAGPPPDGYNVGMNCGAAAGQTIMHFHCHVIPRYRGDVDDPRGGVRHCIPHKGSY